MEAILAHDSSQIHNSRRADGLPVNAFTKFAGASKI